MTKKERLKMRVESDRHITVTEPDGKKLVDDGKVTEYGKKILKKK